MNLLIDESPLVLLPSLAQRIGLDEAIVVQQVHYLVNANANVENSRAYQDNCYWVFNSVDQWQTKYFKWWSVPTVKRIFQGLTECSLLIAKSFGGGKAHNRLWYRVNHPLVKIISEAPLSDFPPNRGDRIKMIRSKWSDQNDPVKCGSSDQNDPVVSDQNDPIKCGSSDQNDPSTIYKRSILNKNSLEREETLTPTESLRTEVISETENQADVSSIPKAQTTILVENQNLALRSKCSAPLAHAETVAERVKRIYYETGVKPKTPFEIQAWAEEDLGAEMIALYRKSGRITTTSRGDIDRDFALYVAGQWGGKEDKDVSYSYPYILKLEQDPAKWETLAALIIKWQAAKTTGDRNLNITKEVSNATRSKELSLNIAKGFSLEDYQ